MNFLHEFLTPDQEADKKEAQQGSQGNDGNPDPSKAEEGGGSSDEGKDAEVDNDNGDEGASNAKKGSQGEGDDAGENDSNKKPKEGAEDAEGSEEDDEGQREAEEEQGEQELTDDRVLQYINEKQGLELENLESLFKKDEEVKDPFEGVSDDIKEFLKFHKETNGRGFDDWNELNKDYSKMSPVEIAREKAIKQSNGQLTEQDVDEYLERRLGINIKDQEGLDKFDLIEVSNYGSDYLEQKMEDQKRFKQPLQDKKDEKKEDTVTLDNGTSIPKKEYDRLVDARKNYLKEIKSASDKIKAANFTVDFDDKGDKQTLDVDYEYSKEDKHSMVSDASDVDKTFARLFKSKEGKVDSKAVQEAMFWVNPQNQKKAISAIVNKAIAHFAENHLEEKNNYKVDNKKVPKGGSQKTVQVPGTQSNYGVKFDFTNS